MQHIPQPGIWPLCQFYFKKHTMKHPLTYQTSNWEGTRYHTFKCSSCVIVTCPTKSENSRYNHNSSWELQCWHALCMDSQPDGMDSIENCRSKNFKVSQGSCLTTCGAFTADAFTSQTEFSPCPSTKQLKSQKQGKPHIDFSGYFTLTGQEVNEVYLHNMVERLPVSFPKTLMRKTPKKAMTAAPHVTVLTRPPDTAEMRGTKTVMVERIKPARIAVVLPSAFVCNPKIHQEWWFSRKPQRAQPLLNPLEAQSYTAQAWALLHWCVKTYPTGIKNHNTYREKVDTVVIITLKCILIPYSILVSVLYFYKCVVWPSIEVIASYIDPAGVKYIIFLEFLYLNDIKKRKNLDYIDLADFKCGHTDTTLVSTVKMLQHLRTWSAVPRNVQNPSSTAGPQLLRSESPAAGNWSVEATALLCSSMLLVPFTAFSRGWSSRKNAVDATAMHHYNFKLVSSFSFYLDSRNKSPWIRVLVSRNDSWA